MSFSKVHEVVCNNQKFIIHEEVLKCFHYFDSHLKGSFKQEQLVLNVDIDSFDFNLFIDIMYRYSLFIKNSNRYIMVCDDDGNKEDINLNLHSNLMDIFTCIFDESITFSDFIGIIILLDYLQPIIFDKSYHSSHFSLDLINILMIKYLVIDDLNIDDILNTNLDEKYKEMLLKHYIDDRNYEYFGGIGQTLYINTKSKDQLICRDLERYLKFFGFMINKIEYKNYCIREDSEGFNVPHADLFINDIFICIVAERYNIVSAVGNFIMEQLLNKKIVSLPQ